MKKNTLPKLLALFGKPGANRRDSARDHGARRAYRLSACSRSSRFSLPVQDLVQLAPPVSNGQAAPETGPLIDTFDRVHDNLRISVTDRCNIRCFYCMPEQGGEFAPVSQLLSFPEIMRFLAAATSLGIRKIRLTGGEPLLRPETARSDCADRRNARP